MSILKTIGFMLIVGGIMTFGSEIGERLSIPGADRLVVTVEARVGRPLTPVSVAGVGRRTVRRCAVGVYDCSVPDRQFRVAQPQVVAMSTKPAATNG